MPGLKRSYQVPSKYTRYSKRARLTPGISRLQQQLALRKPEVKDIVFSRTVAQVDNQNISVDGIFRNIDQGSTGNNRLGDQIRVLSIEICGRVYGVTALDSTFAIVRPNNAERVPERLDWSTAIGGLYENSRGWVLHHSIRDVQTNNALFTTKKITFGATGMLVKYNPPTEANANLPNKNEVYMCHINNTGANVQNISYSVRVRFIDA